MTTNDWFIQHLELRNFRSFADLRIDFEPRVTLLVGRNGSGKTAVLDALAIMLRAPLAILSGKTNSELSSDNKLNFRERNIRRINASVESRGATASIEPQLPVIGTATGILDGAPVSWTRRQLTVAGNTTDESAEVRTPLSELRQRAIGPFHSTEFPEEPTTLPVVATYGVERLVKSRQNRSSLGSSRLDAYAAALEHGSDLTRLSGFIRDLDETIVRASAFSDEDPTAARRQFEAIDIACTRFLAHVGWSGLRWNNAFGELSLKNEDGLRLPLSSLASGAKIAAGLAIDLASRMARANPHLGSHELLESTPGIVLVDEIDMHLHPSWQQMIVPLLCETFPRVQFILTTHSPQVISTVDAENIRIIDGDRVHTPDFAKGLRADKVLHEVQGVESGAVGEVKEALDEYLRLVYGGEGSSARAVELRDRLDGYGGAELIDELKEADVHMAFAELMG